MNEAAKVSVKAKSEPREIPKVSSKKAGQVGQMLEGLAQLFRELNPGKSCRWVYAPLHRGELSNVLGRRAQGYRQVFVKDLGSLDGFDPEDVVRVGDCILMSIPEEVQHAIAMEKQERASSQLKQVEQEFYNNIGGLDERDGAEPRMRPSGRAVIEERDRDYDTKQMED